MGIFLRKKNLCIANSMTVAGYAKRFSHGHFVVSRAWIRRETERGSNTYQPNGEWYDVAEHMLLNFSESGPPVFVEQVLWNEELRKATEAENCLYTSVVIRKLMK